MMNELLTWLQHGVQLDQFSSPGQAMLAAFVVGFAFGLLPTGASELLAIAAGAVTPRALVLPLLVLLTVGHVLGKAVWYWAGTFGDRITHPKAKAWITKAHRFNEEHPRLGVGLMLSSAFASLPPFQLLAIGAGIVRVPLVAFLITALIGRFARFGLVALVPGVVQYVL
jgi:membrane protein YqaA with SNARE-associated domain